ncbi:V-type proton ATPase subunit S1-like [Actinia tenebrosa]|uniref:V-type proton ATPase subunit S1-like n=1 Tax=Actinia tenebrosa TaxID=6105 RepID=A0A6P8IRV3_ACTTE|nr:V-type proton ATPase subunit S1-like [Actinia tenebrosa]
MIFLFKMAAIRHNLVWFLSLLFCHYSLIFASHVPVFMWSKDSPLSPEKPLLAGHTVSAQDFKEKYLRNVLQKTQSVILFLQDRLSIDDVTRYGDAYSTGSHGDAFSNLKFAIQKANSSVVLPSVEVETSGVTSDLIEYVKENIKGKVMIVKGDELKSFKAENYLLDDKVTNVFIINLHPVELSYHESAELAFKENDEVIAMVTKEISKLGTSYTCILTAQAPNKDVSNLVEAEEISSLPHDRFRRDVEADSSENKSVDIVYLNNTLFANGSCVFVYMKGLYLRHFNETFNFFNMSDISGTVESDCSNYSSVSFTMLLKDGGFVVLKLRGDFNVTRSDWKCVKLSATIKRKAGDVSVDKPIVFPCDKEIHVPLKMSYHCYNSTFIGGNYSLSFLNFQIQPYRIKNNKFSYSYDCVGFFSIPILMGLFTTGILLLILFFGIMAVFSITTMDRFDDPKGSQRSFGSTG